MSISYLISILAPIIIILAVVGFCYQPGDIDYKGHDPEH
jgi:hypothetical protein